MYFSLTLSSSGLYLISGLIHRDILVIRKERGTGSSGHLSLRVSAPWEESGAESQQELSTLSKGGGVISTQGLQGQFAAQARFRLRQEAELPRSVVSLADRKQTPQFINRREI